MSANLPNVVFIVAAGKEHGIGHLKRCLTIADSGRRKFDSYFGIIGNIEHKNFRSLINYPLVDMNNPIASQVKNNKIDVYVTDCRDTNKKFMKSLIKDAPIISIDDLGKGARYAVTRIISIPTLKNVEANYNGLKYLVVDPSIDSIKEAIKRKSNPNKNKILISFGGSDPYNLTMEIAEILNKHNLRPMVVKGPLYEGSLENLNVDVVESPENIYELIAGADLLITSFGITMFESIYLGTPVILYNHSKYHYKLSLNYELPNLAYPGYFSKSSLERILIENINNRERLLSSSERYKGLIDTHASERIISIICGTIDNGRRDCLFHHGNYKVVYRKENYSISKCSECGDLFLTKMIDNKEKYRENYFLDDYERQYGKSYIDDKNNIVEAGNTRLDRIERLKQTKGRLLDVGCAMGFFVELASNRGWLSEGIEISEYASRWARNTLGLRVFTGNFLEHHFEDEYYDVITMFYVLEHFSEVEISIVKAYKILKKDGVLALALPNRSGISYRLNKKSFLSIHPDDHFFDTTPGNISKFLLENGFQVKDIRITGIHPERFFSIVGVKKVSKPLARLYSSIANVFHLGDTFEIYAVKK